MPEIIISPRCEIKRTVKPMKRLTCLVAIAALPGIGVPAHAKSVILECKGSFKYCSRHAANNLRCDAPTAQTHVVEFEETSVKQLDDYAFLNFIGKCSSTETMATCSEPVNYKGGPKFDETGTRSMTLDRTTGRISWSYSSTFGPEHVTREKTKAEGWDNRFDGTCTVRQNKTLF